MLCFAYVSSTFDCWNNGCGRRGGKCKACGAGKACCRQGWNDPVECLHGKLGCKGHHCCVNDATQFDCWNHGCGHRGGNCKAFGAGKACCRQGWNDPAECLHGKLGCKGRHCCVNDATQFDCWNHGCGHRGGKCKACGAGKACCRQGWNDPAECLHGKLGCKGFHCCVESISEIPHDTKISKEEMQFL